MRVGALGFAIIQSFGQCTFIRPYVDDFTIQWLAQSIGLLTGGAMGLVFISERLDKLKYVRQSVVAGLTLPFPRCASPRVLVYMCPLAFDLFHFVSVCVPVCSCVCRFQSAPGGRLCQTGSACRGLRPHRSVSVSVSAVRWLLSLAAQSAYLVCIQEFKCTPVACACVRACVFQ